jgi:Tol biopolymer transport system component
LEAAVTVTAPPRPPRPSDHVDRQELEALVEALIEEARQRARRRRRIYAAVAAGVALVAVAVATAVERATHSQTASPALAARSGAAAGGTPSSKIAFVAPTSSGFGRPASWELYVMNPDGSGRRRLARHFWISNFGESPLAWSPDRRKLLFSAHVSRSAAPCASYCGKEIFVINADGSGLRRLTRNTVPDWDPAWSPDGQRIAWLSRGPNGTGAEVFVMNADGSDQQNLTPKPGNRSEPRWSPDGRAILFTAVPPGQPPSPSGWPYSDVYVMNADGSGQRKLTHTPAAGEGDPAWSPDGQQIAFTRLGPPGEVRIVVMNPDGSAKHAVTPTLAHPGDRGPTAVWSPDGQRIAFWDDFAIYVVNADGSGLRRLTRNAFEGPSWSPDGRKLLFVRARHQTSRPHWQGGDLWVMNADGTEQRNLTPRTPTAEDGHAAAWAR